MAKLCAFPLSTSTSFWSICTASVLVIFLRLTELIILWAHGRIRRAGHPAETRAGTNDELFFMAMATTDAFAASTQLFSGHVSYTNVADFAICVCFCVRKFKIFADVKPDSFCSRIYCIVHVLTSIIMAPAWIQFDSASLKSTSMGLFTLFLCIGIRIIISSACAVYFTVSLFNTNSNVSGTYHLMNVPLLVPNEDDTDEDMFDEIPSIPDFFSLTFSWMNSLFLEAQNKALQQEDAPPLPRKCLCRRNGLLLRKLWRNNVDTTSSDTDIYKMGLFRSICRIYGFEYALTGLNLAGSIILGFLGPLFLNGLVNCAERGDSLNIISLYIALLFLSRVLMAFLSTQYSYSTAQLSIAVSAATKSCVFRKILRLSTASRRNFTAGNISNLYTIDIERVVSASMALHSFWSLPLQIVIAMVLLYRVVSTAMFAGLTAIIVLLIANNFLANKQKIANDLVMKSKDNRMKYIGEVLHSILTVKLNVWEERFQQKILSIRDEELKHIWSVLLLAALNICLLWMAPCVVSVVTISVYAEVLKQDISAAKIFTALALFRMLQDPLRSLPSYISQVYQALSSLERLEKFYAMSEKTGVDGDLSLEGTGLEIPIPLPTTAYPVTGKGTMPGGDKGITLLSEPSPPPSSLISSPLTSSLTLLASPQPPNANSWPIRRAHKGTICCAANIAFTWGAAAASDDGDDEGQGDEGAVGSFRLKKKSFALSTLMARILGRRINRRTASGSNGGQDQHRKARGGVGGGGWCTTCWSQWSTCGCINLFGTRSRRGLESKGHRFSPLHDDDDDAATGAVQLQTRKASPDSIMQSSPLPTSSRSSSSSSSLSLSPSKIPSTETSITTTSTVTAATAPTAASNFLLKLPNSLYIRPGQLVVIKGPVGSGKSSLCSALLGEMYPLVDTTTGTTPKSCVAASADDAKSVFNITGDIAYASQQPWIQNQTVRENIVFGLPFNEAWYEKVVTACALLSDFAELEDGDNTAIGEKGLNLSGGQKARVALARAVYANTDVIILDDILAALDSIVGKKVFVECILELLGEKTRVLVTHNEEVINSPYVDLVLSIDRGVVTIIPKNVRVSSFTASTTKSMSMSMSMPMSTVSEAAAGSEPVLVNTATAKSTAATAPLSASTVTSVKKNGSISKLHSLEERAEGNIDKKVYFAYFTAMGGLKVFVFLFIVQTVWQSLSVGSDVFLSSWSRQSDEEQKINLNRNVWLYAFLSLGSGSIVLVRTITISTAGYRAAKLLFERMIASLLVAPMAWFDKNPSGRILNRVSDDQAKVDSSLPFAVGSIYATGFSLGGDLLAVMVITRYLVFAIVPIGWVYVRLMLVYVKASRELQRLTSISQSPVLTFMSECSNGAYIVRAFGRQNLIRFERRNDFLIDRNSQMAYTSNAGSSWFVLRIQLIGAVILLFVAVLAFVGERCSFISAGLVGLSLSYGLSVTNGLQSLVWQVSWFENNMVCPERIQQYIDVAPEGTELQKELFQERDDDESFAGSVVSGGVDLENGNKKTFDGVRWADGMAVKFPPRGSIRFRDVWFKYQPDGECVLKGVSFDIAAGEKVGIVGRTGSGKSSLSMCLLRIAELCRGSVLIDDVNVSMMPLGRLRQAVEIIPQIPVLFKGTLRQYLDPFEEYSDGDIWQALGKAQLTEVVNNLSVRSAAQPMGTENGDIGENCHGNRTRDTKDACDTSDSREHRDVVDIGAGLQAEIEENGNNLSVGERQMLVMARALLRQAKIVVMDEATASVDMATDRKVQEVLRVEFKQSTVFTIAHRIETILTCDKILVMSAGQLVESGHPQDLLQRPNGLFRALAAEHGKDELGGGAGDTTDPQTATV